MISIISVKNLSLSFKEKTIFENLNLEFPDNKLSVIVGPNGAGKSTLLKIITGKFQKITLGKFNINKN